MTLNLSIPPGRGPLSDADERAIDALIGEAQKWTPAPQDLSFAILRELASHYSKSIATVSNTSDLIEVASGQNQNQNLPSASVRSASRSRRRGWRGLALAASAVALAASILFLVTQIPALQFQKTLGVAQGAGSGGQAKDSPSKPQSLATNSNPQTSVLDSVDSGRIRSERINKSADVAQVLPLQGLPMVRKDVEMDTARNENAVEANADLPATDARSPVQFAASLVRLNGTIAKYWEHAGVTPSDSLADSALASRIEKRFGFRPEVSQDQVLLDAAFTTQEDCEKLAERLVDRLFRGAPLVADARKKMVVDATASIVEGQGFDRLVARWIADESLFDRSAPQRLSQSLASNMLDADATCARCHDSPVDGRLAQHDYWAFASALAPADRTSLFYEMSDGRQKVAEARLPQRWFTEADAERLKTLGDDARTQQPLQKQLAESLVGSSTLAGAIANRLWEIGFGASLIPRASDPIAPPRDDTLQKAHQELTDLLLASNFDIRAAARMVIASDAMRRGQTDLVASGRWRLADDETIISDALSVRTFAAAAPAPLRVGRENLLSMMASRLGNAPKELGIADAVLAQPLITPSVGASGTEKDTRPMLEEYLWASWIADRPLLRDSWLHWIKNADEQRRHVYYAVNMSPSKDDADWIQRLTSPSDEDFVASEAANDRLLWVLRKSL